MKREQPHEGSQEDPIEAFFKAHPELDREANQIERDLQKAANEGRLNDAMDKALEETKELKGLKKKK